MNPNVALTFYWFPLHRSIRIEGIAAKIDTRDSEKYFHERPIASQVNDLALVCSSLRLFDFAINPQISAAISPQSQKIPSRAYLEAMEMELKQNLGTDGEVPLPNW